MLMSRPEDRIQPIADAPADSVPQARPAVEPPRAGHPLGPLWQWVSLDGPFGGRVYAAGVLAFSITVMTVAARLNPTGLREGTHQQLGLPPCGFVTMTGLPCPTCGMTTAFSHTIRGQVVQAVESQPAGFVLAVGTILAGVLAAVAMATGRRPALNWYRINPVHLVWIGSVLFVAAWGVKIVLYLLENGSRMPPG